MRSKTKLKLTKDVSRCMSVAMEYLTAELLECAGHEKMGKKKLITVKLLKDGISKDPQLKKMFEQFLSR